MQSHVSGSILDLPGALAQLSNAKFHALNNNVNGILQLVVGRKVSRSNVSRSAQHSRRGHVCPCWRGLLVAWEACWVSDLGDVEGSCPTFAPEAVSTAGLGMPRVAALLWRGGKFFCRIAFAKKNHYESAQAGVPSAISLLKASEAPSTLRKVETLPPPTSCFVLDNYGRGPGIGTRQFRQQNLAGAHGARKDHSVPLRREACSGL